VQELGRGSYHILSPLYSHLIGEGRDILVIGTPKGQAATLLLVLFLVFFVFFISLLLL
jgi:hypothetical protein